MHVERARKVERHVAVSRAGEPKIDFVQGQQVCAHDVRILLQRPENIIVGNAVQNIPVGHMQRVASARAGRLQVPNAHEQLLNTLCQALALGILQPLTAAAKTAECLAQSLLGVVGWSG